jgi:transcriptional regulator with XRE-family HTH domain
MRLEEETIGSRIEELRKDRGWSQKDLAEKINVARSQISRIESGDTKSVGNDILIALAKLFHVSTDYLLGITRISTPKSYDISELGLSEESVKRMITGKIDVDILNRLLEHKSFPGLISLIRNYYDNTVADGIMSRNQIIDLATGSLAEQMQADPTHRSEIRNDILFLASQKIGQNEADTEKIKNVFMSILRDIKAGLSNGELPGVAATTAAVQGIRDALPDKPQNEITAEDMSDAVVAYMRTTTPMDEGTAGLLKQLVGQMLEQNKD